MNNNMSSEVLNEVRDNLLRQPEILAKEFHRLYGNELSSYNKALDSSSLTDKKVIRILQEQSTAEGKYKEKVDKLLKDYLAERKFSGEQLSEVNALLQKSNKVQELQRLEVEESRKREQRENPLTAFKHAFEDFKKDGAKTSAKTLGAGLLQGVNLKTISKTLLHGAGFVFDNPAFNLIADKISTSAELQEINNQREYEFVKELEEGLSEDDSENKKEKQTKAEKTFIEETKEDSNIGISGDNKDVIAKLDTIESNTEATYQDLGSELENIKGELTKQTKIFQEQLFMQKDLANEPGQKSNIASYNKGIAGKPEEEEEEGDFGLLGSLAEDLMGGNRNGRRGRKGGVVKGVGNAVKGLGSMAMGLARIAGPIALVTAGVIGVYEGIKGYQNAAETFDLDPKAIATQSQKITSGIASALDALSFGLLDEKVVAKKIDQFTSSLTSGIKKILGVYENSDMVVDDLQNKNVIDASIIGDSQVRDWDAMSKLSLKELEAVYNYNDWDKDTAEKLRGLIRTKKREAEPAPIKYEGPVNVNKTLTQEQTTEADKRAELNKEAIKSNVGKMSKEDRDNWYKEKGYDTSTGKFTESNQETKIESAPVVQETKIESAPVVQEVPVVQSTPIKSVTQTNTADLSTTPNVSDKELPNPQNQVEQVAPIVNVSSPQPTVINNSTPERKIDTLNLTDKDSMTLVGLLGIGR